MFEVLLGDLFFMVYSDLSTKMLRLFWDYFVFNKTSNKYSIKLGGFQVKNRERACKYFVNFCLNVGRIWGSTPQVTVFGDWEIVATGDQQSMLQVILTTGDQRFPILQTTG